MDTEKIADSILVVGGIAAGLGIKSNIYHYQP